MVAEVSTRPSITEETLPRWDANERTAKVSDKSCIICMKRKMSQDCLADHLDYHHEVMFSDEANPSLEECLEADENWQRKLEINPPNPLPRDYNSEKG